MSTRDTLAYQRTGMANQRTLLSYVRTSLFCLVAGITLMKLQPNDKMIVALSVFLLLASLFAIIFGAYQYNKNKQKVTSQ